MDSSENEPRKVRENLIKRLFDFLTVEPFLFFYLLPIFISAVAVQKLNLAKACLVDLKYSESVCANVVTGDRDNTTETALNAAQVLVARMASWTQPLQSGLPAVMILFVGAWSDRTGNRKILMLIPILGQLISSIGLLLTIYYFLEWPLWVTGLIENLPTALSGGVSIALMGSYSHIADITSVDSRTFRIGLAGIIALIGYPLGSSISGILTETIGYYGVFGISCTLYTISFIYTYFRIKDVKKVQSKGTLLEDVIKFFHPINVWDTISVLFKGRRGRLVHLLLIIFAYMVIIGPVYGEGTVVYLYAVKKFNFDPIEYSLYLTYSAVVGLIGSSIAITVISKWLKLPDTIMGVIATTSKVMSSFVYGLAPNKPWFYSGSIFDMFGGSAPIAVRSLGTKIVDPEEVGKICSIVGVAEAIVPVIYTPIYSTLYANTLDKLPGAFYLLGGFMTVPALGIFIYLYFALRNNEEDTVHKHEEKEMHAYNSKVPRF